MNATQRLIAASHLAKSAAPQVKKVSWAELTARLNKSAAVRLQLVNQVLQTLKR